MIEKIIKEVEGKERELAKESMDKLIELGYDFPMAYLPNIKPPQKANFFFVAMEPSMGKWAKTSEKGIEMVENGFINFLHSKDDFILHYSINMYLSENYHITDVSKIAMKIDKATEVRKLIYPMWRNHLKFEIEKYSGENFKIISVGKTPIKELELIFPGEKIYDILHFSASARGFRKKEPENFPEEYKVFENEFSLDELVEFSVNYLSRNVANEEMRNYISNYGIKNLKKGLTESDKKLLFTYKKTFEKIKKDND